MKKFLQASLLFAGVAASMTAFGPRASTSEQEGHGAIADEARMASGFQTLKTACFGCHSPKSAMETRAAPPMSAVKRHYLDPDMSITEFSEQLVTFVNDPSTANIKMPNARQKFGEMPQLSMERQSIEDVAYYLYYTSLEAPGWFEGNYEAEQRKYAQQSERPLKSNADYLRHGKEIAMSTKVALGSKLKQALNSGGPNHAVEFCNVNAAPIAQQQSGQFNAQISRVSDRPRNPANAANDHELAYISATKAALAEGQKPKPRIREIDGQMVGYYPIVTNGMCLQCHGTPGKELTTDTLAAINKLYPLDKAIGYAANELRGIFVVEMPKE